MIVKKQSLQIRQIIIGFEQLIRKDQFQFFFRQLDNQSQRASLKTMLDQQDDMIQEQGNIWSHFFLQQERSIDLPQNLVNLNQSQQSQFEQAKRNDVFPQEENGTTQKTLLSVGSTLNPSNSGYKFADRKSANSTKCYDEESKSSFFEFLERESQLEIGKNVISHETKNGFSPVFQEKKLRCQWKKNTNIPKFLVRIFLKYFKKFASAESSLQEHFEEISNQLQERSSNNFCIADVLSLLRSSDGNEGIRRANQKILAEIIQSTLMEEVMKNGYIKQNRKSYMMAMKIQTSNLKSKNLMKTFDFYISESAYIDRNSIMLRNKICRLKENTNRQQQDRSQNLTEESIAQYLLIQLINNFAMGACLAEKGQSYEQNLQNSQSAKRTQKIVPNETEIVPPYFSLENNCFNLKKDQLTVKLEQKNVTIGFLSKKVEEQLKIIDQKDKIVREITRKVIQEKENPYSGQKCFGKCNIMNWQGICNECKVIKMERCLDYSKIRTTCKCEGFGVVKGEKVNNKCCQWFCKGKMHQWDICQKCFGHGFLWKK